MLSEKIVARICQCLTLLILRFLTFKFTPMYYREKFEKINKKGTLIFQSPKVGSVDRVRCARVGQSGSVSSVSRSDRRQWNMRRLCITWLCWRSVDELLVRSDGQMERDGWVGKVELRVAPRGWTRWRVGVVGLQWKRGVSESRPLGIGPNKEIA